MSVHRLIREGRAELRMTHEEFAKTCGVSRGAVQQWEREGGTAPKRTRQAEVDRRAEVGERTLFKALSKDGHPTIATVHEVLHAVWLKLSVTPA